MNRYLMLIALLIMSAQVQAQTDQPTEGTSSEQSVDAATGGDTNTKNDDDPDNFKPTEGDSDPDNFEPTDQ